MTGDNRGRRVLTTVVGLWLLLLVVLTGGGPAEAQTPGPPAEPATATISGVVRDAGGTPVGDVVVDLFRQSGSQPTDRGEFLTFTRTDVDGRYTFEADADQSFVLVFIAPDGHNFERDRYLRMPVATAGGQDQNVDVAFSATTDAVIGGLLINQDGVPQSGRATLFAAGGDGSRSTYLGADDISPADGEFSFNVAPGCYIIDVTHGNLGFDGNRWFQAAGCVEAGETDLSIRAVLTGRITAEIRGTVRIGAEGEELLPAADVQVELYLPCCRPGERTFLQTTRTAPDGTYSFTAAIGQSYLIVVFAPEGTTFPDGTTEAERGPINIGNREHDFVLRPPAVPPSSATLGGMVDNASTLEPAPGVKVTIFDSSADGQRGEFLGEVLTGEDGRFAFEVAEPGCYWIIFVAPDGDGFLGSPYFERTACVELGDEVTDLNATIDGVRGLPTPSISMEDVTVTEPDSGSVTVEIPVVLESVDDDINELDYRIRSFSAATNETDYDAPETGTLVFQPGETVKIITIDVLGDTDWEETTTITVSASNRVREPVTNAPITARAELTIEDNDPFTPLTVTMADQAAYEGTGDRLTQPPGREYGWFMVVELNREVQPTEEFDLTFATEDGTATLADEDYATRFNSATAQVRPGARSALFGVNSIGDDRVEPDETFVVTVVANDPDVVIADGTATFTILDDDGNQAPEAIVTVEALTTQGPESDFGFIQLLPVTIRLSEPADFQRFVYWWGVDGTATLADRDYESQLIGGRIFPGETELVSWVRFRGDNTPEPDETFTITALELSAGLVNGTDPIEFTILNDD